jgi:hypothetical protein
MVYNPRKPLSFHPSLSATLGPFGLRIFSILLLTG